MAVGTDFTVSVFLRGITPRGMWEVDDDIAEQEEIMTRVQRRLSLMAMGDPKVLPDKEWEGNVLEWIESTIDEEMDLFRDAATRWQKLILYKDYLLDKERNETLTEES